MKKMTVLLGLLIITLHGRSQPAQFSSALYTKALSEYMTLNYFTNTANNEVFVVYDFLLDSLPSSIIGKRKLFYVKKDSICLFLKTRKLNNATIIYLNPITFAEADKLYVKFATYYIDSEGKSCKWKMVAGGSLFKPNSDLIYFTFQCERREWLVRR